MAKVSTRQFLGLLLIIALIAVGVYFYNEWQKLESTRLPLSPLGGRGVAQKSRGTSIFSYLLNESGKPAPGAVLGSANEKDSPNSDVTQTKSNPGLLDRILGTFEDLGRAPTATPIPTVTPVSTVALSATPILTPTQTPTTTTTTTSTPSLAQQAVISATLNLETLLVAKSYNSLYQMMSSDFRSTFNQASEFVSSLQSGVTVSSITRLDNPVIFGGSSEWAEENVTLFQSDGQKIGDYKIIWHKEDAVWKIFGTDVV